VDSEWPRSGKVTFDDVKLRYRPKTEMVLKGLDLEIQGGHKVGIVGRTGAGKSTVSLALTRIIELASGSIRIDGVDISKVNIGKLREKITIIAQDPTLFTGSIRMNIDPQSKCTDEEILSLLKRAGLESLVTEQKEDEELKTGLEFQVEEGGKNLSSGEKSLICICRAIIRKNKVVILDEATANIDLKTEQRIQALIKKEFAGCTVMTIAHRLQTIIESDQILMLDQGTVLEFGSPKQLMNTKTSRFNQMIADLKNSAHQSNWA
jgi:ABC-type multidrug transport system fused ATPase/permease subunit